MQVWIICWWTPNLTVKRSEREVENELLLSKEKTLCRREFELHFIFCVPDWWPMRWMMFCSAVWHCLILADTKRENTYHLRVMYGAGGRGCQTSEEGPGEWGVARVPPDKAWGRWANDSRGRWREPSPMTTHQNLHPEAREGRIQKMLERNRARGP